MPSGRTNNFTESGRGLGHVTPTIFGSTVGYPSDSLASCGYIEVDFVVGGWISWNLNLNLIVDGPGSSSAFDVHIVPICVQSRLETVHWGCVDNMWQTIPVRNHSVTEEILPLFIFVSSRQGQTTEFPSPTKNSRYCLVLYEESIGIKMNDLDLCIDVFKVMSWCQWMRHIRH